MYPLSPVIPDKEADESIYAKGQPQYANLPCIKNEDGDVIITRWSVNEEEKKRICEQGFIYLLVNTYAGMPPVMLSTYVPNDMGFELKPLEAWPEEIGE